MNLELEELNLQVAKEWGWTEVMSLNGQTIGIPPESDYQEYFKTSNTTQPSKRPIPNFVGDMNDAWRIVKKYGHTYMSNSIGKDMAFSNFSLIAYPDNGWCCMMGEYSDYGKTASEAISRTFLEMKEKERSKQ
jgi:hypothetical protein